MDETQHVGMCNAHHSHVRAASHTTLLHDISHLIDNVHERDWTRSNAGRRTHHRSVRPEELISHAGAAASLMNCRSSFCMFHDPGQGIGNFENKTGCELAICL